MFVLSYLGVCKPKLWKSRVVKGIRLRGTSRGDATGAKLVDAIVRRVFE